MHPIQRPVASKHVEDDHVDTMPDFIPEEVFKRFEKY